MQLRSDRGGVVLGILIALIILITGGIWFVSEYVYDRFPIANYPVIPMPTPDIREEVVRQLEMDDTEFVVDAKNSAILPESTVLVEFRKVHEHMSFQHFSTNALPYVQIGDDWLEIVAKVEIYLDGLVYVLTNNSCDSIDQFHGDYYIKVLESCTISISTEEARMEMRNPVPFSKKLNLASTAGWHATLSSIESDEVTSSIRMVGYSLGNVDRTQDPPMPTSLDSGLDIVTTFGVANLPIDYFDQPVRGQKEEVVVGPHRITVEVLDVGNTNTHCHTGRCLNVFEVQVDAEVIDVTLRDPVILHYK